MIEAVVFDLDDTLYPEHDYVLSGFDAAGAWLAHARGIPGFAACAREIFATGARGRVFDEALQALGVADDGALVKSLVEVYRAHAPRISLYPDAVKTLDALRGRVKLGLITDGWLEVQRAKVRALTLEDTFDAIVFSDAFGREKWKPHAQPYETAAEALSTDASRCVYVGDNPAKDFITARRLGWRTVQICREHGEYAHAPPSPDHRPHAVIRDLTEVLAIVLA